MKNGKAAPGAGNGPSTSLGRLKEFLLGAARNPLDRRVFRTVSLVAVLAWVGMGADGISSSCYGPERAFLALGEHKCLVIPLAAFVALAVFLISATYSQIIELFARRGVGSGYVVATSYLGAGAGVLSGSALVVDYVLTIAVSIAAATDAFFSFLPIEYQAWKVLTALVVLAVLLYLNLRGLREAVITLTPVFFLFVLTHVGVMLWAFVAGIGDAATVVVESGAQTGTLVREAGMWGMILILMRAFSLGGGTYTGIEAVSNGLAVMREPRAETGKKTMTYMAFSLSFMACGLLLCYLLVDVQHVAGRTLNASLFDQVWGTWTIHGIAVGKGATILALFSEAALLVVATQSGFVGGPQVLSNMAIDYWVPRRFANLSDRLVNQDGLVMMALASGLILILTGGRVDFLVIMYSINVFITFTLSQLAMCRHWIAVRGAEKKWLKGVILNGAGMILTSWILVFTLVIKFGEGGWITIVVTGGLIAACILIKSHYLTVRRHMRHLDELLTNLRVDYSRRRVPRKDVKAPTAVLMVSGYNGLGIHTLFSIMKLFPDRFKNLIFVEVGTIDSARFKNLHAIHELEHGVKEDLEQYVELGHNLGFHAESQYALNVDRLEALETLCATITKEFKDCIFFVGKLVFERETWTSNLLHSQTALSIQKKLLFAGYQVIVMPVRLRA